MKSKEYVGNGLKFGEYDQVAISFALEDVEKYAKKAKNGKHYINLVVSALREKNQWGKTHTVYIDQWEKKTEEEVVASVATEKELTEQYGPAQKEPKEPKVKKASFDDMEDIDVKDIPF